METALKPWEVILTVVVVTVVVLALALGLGFGLGYIPPPPVTSGSFSVNSTGAFDKTGITIVYRIFDSERVDLIIPEIQETVSTGAVLTTTAVPEELIPLNPSSGNILGKNNNQSCGVGWTINADGTLTFEVAAATNTFTPGVVGGPYGSTLTYYLI